MRRLVSSFPVQLIALTLLLLGGLGLLRSGGENPQPRAAAAVPGDPASASVAASDPGEASGGALRRRGEAESARRLFAHTCGMCHTLRAAGSQGRFGPDLDAADPSARRVRTMIRRGSLDGIMQPRLLTGADARRVAGYVERVSRG